ncbi:MAG: PEP-CTERM sorting domain-containing protein [Bacteroidetes bacterium]|nr:MAG: PEP-CTERM sorting domain-containing protein [Bacteroidota bacterium]
MKKLTLLMTVIFCSVVFVQAQKAPTVSDPNIVPTISPEQIEELGQQNQNDGGRAVIVLDFEGLGNGDAINDFYNGGTSGAGFSGTNYGVEFGVALGLIDADAGGTGNFANEPSPSTAMFFLSNSTAFMNVAAGFNTGFSAFYSANVGAGSISIYDGLNGSGNLLATIALPVNWQNGSCSGDPTGDFCNWDPVSIPFAGTAKSVTFSGVANHIIFDDVTFGSLTPGGNAQIPVSNWAIILGLMLIGTFIVVRYRRTLA